MKHTDSGIMYSVRLRFYNMVVNVSLNVLVSHFYRPRTQYEERRVSFVRIIRHFLPNPGRILPVLTFIGRKL